MKDNDSADAIVGALRERFGEDVTVDPSLPGLDELARMAGHRVCRRYRSHAVDRSLLRLLCACALSAPTKSDLQQCDIVVVDDPALREAITDLIPDLPWVKQAPAFLVFLANGRRLPALAQQRGKPFPNDHLDLFFNSVLDAGLVLASFVRAAEAVGLGCCPISVIRDRAADVSAMLGLPARVVPIAGLCVGWPAETGQISPRLSLQDTVHVNRHDEDDLAARVDAYDRRRAATRPYAGQRDRERWGEADFYGWSEDKARQYAKPQRTDFGTFVRQKGFCLD